MYLLRERRVSDAAVAVARTSLARGRERDGEDYGKSVFAEKPGTSGSSRLLDKRVSQLAIVFQPRLHPSMREPVCQGDALTSS
jgi:hypothetical protein